MFTFLERSSQEDVGQEDLKVVPVLLSVGDVLLWRGECVSKFGDGEGGVMQILTYR